MHKQYPKTYKYFTDQAEYRQYKYGFVWGQQCHARAKGTGVQCKKPAVVGYPVCRLHGARGGRRVPEGKEMDLANLTKEERVTAYALLHLFLEDWAAQGNNPLNVDKVMLADAVALFIKSQRKFTDRQSWKETKYKDLFLKYMKELNLTAKERKRTSAVESMAQSFDLVLSRGKSKSKTQGD